MRHGTRIQAGAALAAAACALAALAGCVSRLAPGGRPPAAVVLYVSLDEPYARPVLDSFTRETGVAVRPVFDTEANKSRGLARRIATEAGRPQADVFWSSEVMQMVQLRQEGALEPYRSPSADGIPARFSDPEGYWTGFAARFRVLITDTRQVKAPPQSLLDLARPEWKGKVAMANPLFGTTLSEAAALFQVLGPEKARDYYRARQQNKTLIVDGNSVAAELVARGDAAAGQTDTDDVYVRLDQGQPVQVTFPDQAGMGALLIPNTAALVRGGPHPEAGKRFLDYLLRPETELKLAGLPSRQLPLHAGLEARLPEKVRPLAKVRTMRVDYARLAERYAEVNDFLRETFLQ